MPPWIYEHTLAKHYGWSLSEIRNMDLHDFHIHLRICFAREAADNEFKLNLAGASAGIASGENQSTTASTTNARRQKSGAITETKSERKVLRKQIGSLRVDKKTGKVISFKQPELPEEG